MSALPGWWRWMPGMRTTDGHRIVDDREMPAWPDSGNSWEAYHATGSYDRRDGWQPDPSDPATIGCLTARVREVCDYPTVTATCRRRLRIPGDAASGWEDGPWAVTVSSSSVTIEIASGPTEWSALMAAGDAAWARRGGAA